MKKPMIITLLSTAVFLAVPSLSYADNGNVFKHNANVVIHANKQKKAKHRKQHKPRFVKKEVHTHKNKKHRHNKHTHRHTTQYDDSFSISWNFGNGTVSVGNGYNNTYNSGYNHSYHKPTNLTRGKKIYKRINKQARRIQQGINNGQLVKREARKLRREQKHIKHTMANFKRDGYLNRYERNKMNQLLDVASNNIKRKRQNRLTRYSRPHKQHNNTHQYEYVYY